MTVLITGVILMIATFAIDFGLFVWASERAHDLYRPFFYLGAIASGVLIGLGMGMVLTST